MTSMSLSKDYFHIWNRTQTAVSDRDRSYWNLAKIRNFFCNVLGHGEATAALHRGRGHWARAEEYSMISSSWCRTCTERVTATTSWRFTRRRGRTRPPTGYTILRISWTLPLWRSTMTCSSRQYRKVSLTQRHWLWPRAGRCCGGSRGWATSTRQRVQVALLWSTTRPTSVRWRGFCPSTWSPSTNTSSWVGEKVQQVDLHLCDTSGQCGRDPSRHHGGTPLASSSVC